jgi:hypothetical protein
MQDLSMGVIQASGHQAARSGAMECKVKAGLMQEQAGLL